MTQKNIFLHPSNVNQMVEGRSGTTVLCEVSFATAWSSSSYGDAYSFLRGVTPSNYYRVDVQADVAIDMTFSKKLKFINYFVTKNSTNWLSLIEIYNGSTLVGTFYEPASTNLALDLNGVIGNRIVLKGVSGSTNIGYAPYANLFNGLLVDDSITVATNTNTDFKIGGDIAGTADSQLTGDGWSMFAPFSTKTLTTSGTREKVYANTTWSGWDTKMPLFYGYSDTSTTMVNGMTSSSGSYIQKTWDRPSGYYMFLYGFRDTGGPTAFISINNVVKDTCAGGLFRAVKLYVATGDVVRIGEPSNTIFSFAGYYSAVQYPSTPVFSSPTITTKNFGDTVTLSWNSVAVPIQPDGGTPLDVNKVFYELYYMADGVNQMLLVDNIDTTSYEAKIIAGGSSASKFAIRSYVLIQGVRYYSSYTYTNTFTTSSPPQGTVFPNSLLFNGTNSYLTISSRILPLSGPWTIEFSIKTTQTNGNLLSIDSGATSILLCQLNNGKLLTSINGSGGTTLNVNDNKIHHVWVINDGSVTRVYLDGVYMHTILTSLPTSTGTVYLGTSTFTGATNIPLYIGVLGLPRFWNTARTEQQLIDNMNKVVSDNETGLIDYMVFDSLTGLVKFKKNSYSILSSNSGISWISLFSPLSEAIMPYPNQFQRKENLEYLREKTNIFRVTNGLDMKTWTDPVLVKGFTPIKAVHWNEVEGAILEVYSIIGQTISSSEVEKQLNKPIIPKDIRYPINGLQQRINNITKGLKNI